MGYKLYMGVWVPGVDPGEVVPGVPALEHR